jgi:hypothetical protein
VSVIVANRGSEVRATGSKHRLDNLHHIKAHYLQINGATRSVSINTAVPYWTFRGGGGRWIFAHSGRFGRVAPDSLPRPDPDQEPQPMTPARIRITQTHQKIFKLFVNKSPFVQRYFAVAGSVAFPRARTPRERPSRWSIGVVHIRFSKSRYAHLVINAELAECRIGNRDPGRLECESKKIIFYAHSPLYIILLVVWKKLATIT